MIGLTTYVQLSHAFYSRAGDARWIIVLPTEVARFEPSSRRTHLRGCGLGTDNGWHDGQTIDIQVTCPRCGREIALLSGDAHLEGFEYQELGHPSEWVDGYVSDLVLG